jgi:hypothetical protein
LAKGEVHATNMHMVHAAKPEPQSFEQKWTTEQLQDARKINKDSRNHDQNKTKILQKSTEDRNPSYPCFLK